MNRKTFLKTKVKSESSMKSYMTIFKRVQEHELLIGKGIEDWNKQDVLDLLGNMGSRKYSTVSSKWSLLKKYLYYIDNEVYREITKQDLMKVEDSTLIYISYEDVVDNIECFKNNIDKALILLLRNGIKGRSFEELTNLKVENIENNKIKLYNREVLLDNYTSEIVQKAIQERGYRMNVDLEKKNNYDYYSYNMESEYLWKNRRTKFNNDGLNPLTVNASKDKIGKLIRRMEVEGLTATSLVMSYVVDRVMDFENENGIILTETQVDNFINKLGVKSSMYAVYTTKNSLRKDRD